MNIKEQKGITLMVLMMTVTIMLILAGTIAITISSYGDVRKLDDLYSDLQVLREAVDIYYEKNGELPITNIVVDNFSEVLGDTKNGNDGPRYYKMDLQLLGNINLIYGSEKFETDYFAINEQSHTIYYCGGVKVGNKTYYGIKEIDSLSAQQQFGIDSFELKTRVNAVNENGTLDIQLEVYTEIESDNISKYKFKINNEDWTVAQDAKTYTFHNLKKLETYKVSMMAIDNNNNEIYATNNDTKVTIKSIPANMTIDGKTKGTYNNPLIPAGFTAINENNAIWGSSDGYKNGLVITDDIDESGKSIGNEFVWVPVDLTLSDEIKTKINEGNKLTVEEIQSVWERKDWLYGSSYTESTRSTLNTNELFEPYMNGYSEEQNEYIEMGTSVLKNGGFYVGRYEGGVETPRTAATASTQTLLSKPNVYPYNFIVWGKAMNDIGELNTGSKGAVELCREVYTGKDGYGVNSSLIYGVQWDSIMEWIESERNVSNSTIWGNYNDSIYTITSGTEYYNGTNWIVAESDVEKTASDKYLLKTGGYTTTKTNGVANTKGMVKNIFDLAGNCWEWSMEAHNDTNRAPRGSSYGNDGQQRPASSRGSNAPTESYALLGVRVALYLR